MAALEEFELRVGNLARDGFEVFRRRNAVILSAAEEHRSRHARETVKRVVGGAGEEKPAIGLATGMAPRPRRGWSIASTANE